MNKAAMINILSNDGFDISELEKMKKADMVKIFEANNQEKVDCVEEVNNKTNNFFDEGLILKALWGQDLDTSCTVQQVMWTSNPKNADYYRIDAVLAALVAAEIVVDTKGFITDNGENARITSIVDLLERESVYKFEAVSSYRKREFTRLYRLHFKHNAKKSTVQRAFKDMKGYLASVDAGFRVLWNDIDSKIPSMAGYLVTKTETVSTGTGEKEVTSGSATVGWAKFQIGKDSGLWELTLYDGPVLRKSVKDPDVIEILKAFDLAKVGMTGNDAKVMLVDPVIAGAFPMSWGVYALRDMEEATVDRARSYFKIAREIGFKVAACLPIEIKSRHDAESFASVGLSTFESMFDSVGVGKKKQAKALDAQKAECDKILSLLKGYEAVLAYDFEGLSDLVKKVQAGKAELEALSQKASKPRAGRGPTKAEREAAAAAAALKANIEKALQVYNSLIATGMDPAIAEATAKLVESTFEKPATK